MIAVLFQVLIIQACQAERIPAAASLSPSTSSAPLVSTSGIPSHAASSEPTTSVGPEPVGQSTSPETDAGAWKPEDHKSVILDRPHTLLLMSAVTGGVAIRGAFTGAMARQFAKADGKTTINDMVTNAIVDMKKNEKERLQSDSRSEKYSTEKSHSTTSGFQTQPSTRQWQSIQEKTFGKAWSIIVIYVIKYHCDHTLIYILLLF